MCVQVGFNVELGGYFSVKRNTMSIDGDTFLTQDQVVPYCKALLEVFRCRPHRHLPSNHACTPVDCDSCSTRTLQLRLIEALIWLLHQYRLM